MPEKHCGARDDAYADQRKQVDCKSDRDGEGFEDQFHVRSLLFFVLSLYGIFVIHARIRRVSSVLRGPREYPVLRPTAVRGSAADPPNRHRKFCRFRGRVL